MVSINETALGDFILSVLDSKGWSLRKGATKIGVSPAYLSKITNHKADSNPKPSTLDKIAEGLDVDKNSVYRAAHQAIAPSPYVQQPVGSIFDIGKAIDNDEYMTNHGKQLTDKEKAMLKALFGE